MYMWLHVSYMYTRTFTHTLLAFDSQAPPISMNHSKVPKDVKKNTLLCTVEGRRYMVHVWPHVYMYVPSTTCTTMVNLDT